MESTFHYILLGFESALTFSNIAWIVFGGLLGTIIGMLPGLGPVTGIAVLIPLTFGMDPTTALITLCAVYYGAMYGGSRSSILLNTPGDSSAITATFDGYPMTQQGRAGPALAISAIASFIGGIVAVVLMTVLAIPISDFALRFGPPEYFGLMIFALAATVSVNTGSMLKSLIGMFFGLMISTIGVDIQTGLDRFTLGSEVLQDGIHFLPVIMGLFALAEVVINFEQLSNASASIKQKIGRVWITREDWKQSKWAIARGTPLGFIIGVLPGVGPSLAAWMSYIYEQQTSKHPEKFGKGTIEGLAGPEAANNAASVGALIPMLTLGIPGSGSTAVMLGALIMLGISPGPLLFAQRPEVAWAVIDSMYLGNIILAIINIPLAGLLVKVLQIPRQYMLPMIIGLAFIGTYAINYSTFEFFILVLFGVIGYLFRLLKIPAGPPVLSIILGVLIEQSFRQSMTISGGSLMILFTRPISAVMLLLTVAVTIYPSYALRRRRKKSRQTSCL